jgi:hypothetical protein
MSDNDYTLTQKEAADFLNVSTKSISRYRKRGLPYKLILNPVTGKQEVRFRYADLERWDEGRQLLAAYPRDGEATMAARTTAAPAPAESAAGANFLNDLLMAYKEQIELLRDQLEDMREQLARRDRQIDDLMRLMVGLQLEYKPLPTRDEAGVVRSGHQAGALAAAAPLDDLYQVVEIEPTSLSPLSPAAPLAQQEIRSSTQPPVAQKLFSREELAASISRLRHKGKSYEEIARGLNQLAVATLSGHPTWTVPEVQSLLPPLVDGSHPDQPTGNGA